MSSLSPITSSLLLISCAVIAAASESPLLCILSFVDALLYSLTDRHTRAARHAFCALTLVLMTLINPLISHRGATPLFFIGDAAITLESIAYGAYMGTLTAACLYWFFSLTDVLTSDKLTYLLSRLSPRYALMLSMSLRYVPILIRHYKAVKRAQTSLGLYGDGSAIDKMKAEALVLDATISWAIEKGIVTADSMRSRGYGTARRTSYSIFVFTKRDALICALTVALSCVCIIALATGALSFKFYPSVSRTPSSLLGIAGAGCYCALALLPTLVCVAESIKWRILRSGAARERS